MLLCSSSSLNLVSGMRHEERNDTSKKISRQANGRCEKTLPLSALPNTPKHMMQFVPFPLSFIQNNSGRQTPNTSMILVSQSLMKPQIAVCISGVSMRIKATKRAINEPINSCNRNFLLQNLTALKNAIFAIAYTMPTMMVLIQSETPNLSKVNCVLQQNICIMNIRIDPPIIAFNQFGSSFSLNDLSLNLDLFCQNSLVYSVRIMAEREQMKEHKIRKQKKTV